MIGRIRVIADEKLDARGHAAVDLVVTTNDGRTHLRQLDIKPGFPWCWPGRRTTPRAV